MEEKKNFIEQLNEYLTEKTGIRCEAKNYEDIKKYVEFVFSKLDNKYIEMHTHDEFYHKIEDLFDVNYYYGQEYAVIADKDTAKKFMEYRKDVFNGTDCWTFDCFDENFDELKSIDDADDFCRIEMYEYNIKISEIIQFVADFSDKYSTKIEFNIYNMKYSDVDETITFKFAADHGKISDLNEHILTYKVNDDDPVELLFDLWKLPDAFKDETEEELAKYGIKLSFDCTSASNNHWRMCN